MSSTATAIDPESRAIRNRHRAAVVWLTGLPGAGKSTIARGLEAELFRRRVQVCVLDGDELRGGLCRDLGFSRRDRSENVRRAAEVAAIATGAGMMAIASIVSPYRSDRIEARAIVRPAAFVEVFVDCPLAECERRDPKGLYARARAGSIAEFTGVSSPYEAPEAPDIRLLTDRTSVAESIARIVRRLEEFDLLAGQG